MGSTGFVHFEEEEELLLHILRSEELDNGL